jgi:hypothetical protein
LGFAAQEGKVLAEDGVVEPDGTVHLQRGGGELDVAAGIVELDLDLLVGAGDAAELVDEIHVPGRAAELPIGGGLQANVALHGDDIADCLVLNGFQFVGADPAGGVVGASGHQVGGPQQAPDVVGAKWRRVSHGQPPWFDSGSPT